MSVLLKELIADQSDLSAVERFANRKETDGPSMERYYHDLIPATLPGVNQQYSFEVDLDKCSGCKACVTACHSLNGLEEKETWRDVGLLVGQEKGQPYLQTVTTACHHCAEPGCLEGCPVAAYDKDLKTGIVRHLDDQCIGCQYCTMKCPYDVPKYSKRLGIVRKCDMCQDRLSAGEAPACVQACPHQAIAIRIVDVSKVPVKGQIVPGAFDSSYTKPTTQYKTRRAFPSNTKPADSQVLRLEHPHWPLIVMLTLSQIAAGAFSLLAVTAWVDVELFGQVGPAMSAFAFATLNIGLLASVFHLGRPLGAWRFFLGLKTSWMSREILAFGIFAGGGFAAVVATWLLQGIPAQLATSGAALMGLLAVFTSVMIYADTKRPFWKFSLTSVRFFGATITLGSTELSIAMALAQAREAALLCTATAIIVMTFVFIWEQSALKRAFRNVQDPLHRSALVIWSLLPAARVAGIVLFTASILVHALTFYSEGNAVVFLAMTAFALSISFLIVQRYLFFTAVHAPRMPGGV